MPGTHIILVNWNGHRDTIECLESLLRLDSDDFAVVVVDNGSSDGSVAALQDWAAGEPLARPVNPVWRALPAKRRHAPTLRTIRAGDGAAPDGTRITLIEAGANLGFAGANNLGMDFAAGDPAMRFLWVLNNDTVADPASLTRLRTHAERHPDEAIIGATLLFYHQPDMVQGLGGWANPGRALAGHIGFGLAADSLPPAEDVEGALAYVMGASMFVRRAAFEATGGMSTAYFLYFEELDWAKRLPAHMRQGVCLDARVWHKEGGSIGTSSTARPSDTSTYYLAASTLRFFWRHERRHLPVALARQVYDALRHLLKRDPQAARVIAQALIDAAMGRRRRGAYGSAEFIAQSQGTD